MALEQPPSTPWSHVPLSVCPWVSARSPQPPKGSACSWAPGASVGAGRWLLVPFGPLGVWPTGSWGLGGMGILLFVLPVTSKKCPFLVPEEVARIRPEPSSRWVGRVFRGSSAGSPRVSPHRGRPAAAALLSRGQRGYECHCHDLARAPVLTPSTVSRRGGGCQFSMTPHREWLLSPRPVPRQPSAPQGLCQTLPQVRCRCVRHFLLPSPPWFRGDRTPCPERWGLALGEFRGPSVISCVGTRTLGTWTLVWQRVGRGHCS